MRSFKAQKILLKLKKFPLRNKSPLEIFTEPFWFYYQVFQATKAPHFESFWSKLEFPSWQNFENTRRSSICSNSSFFNHLYAFHPQLTPTALQFPFKFTEKQIFYKNSPKMFIFLPQCSNNWSRRFKTEHGNSWLALRLASRRRQALVAGVPPNRPDHQRSSHGPFGSERHQLLPRHCLKDWRQHWRLVGGSRRRFTHAVALLIETTPHMEELQNEDLHHRTNGRQLDSD